MAFLMSSSKVFAVPKKIELRRLAYSPVLYKIKSAISRLLNSFRCQVGIWGIRFKLELPCSLHMYIDEGLCQVLREWMRFSFSCSILMKNFADV